MENDHRVDIVSLEIDRDVTEASAESQSESTLSKSLESGITAETSRGDADSKLDDCAGWTNEKHNSYLDYLESSFVRQLYSFLGAETHRLSRTRDVQSNSCKSTDQFTVLQNGCLQKLNFEKKQAHLEETTSEFRFQKNSLRSNPENPNDKAFTRTSLRNSVGHEYPAQVTAEASGQNFREEEEEEGKEGVNRKREREANNEDSSLKEDQVVPVRMVKPRM